MTKGNTMIEVTLRGTQRETAQAVIDTMAQQGLTETAVVFNEPFLENGEYGESQVFIMHLTEPDVSTVVRRLRAVYERLGVRYPGAVFRRVLAQV